MRKFLVVLIVLFAASPAARAFINPNFTPVDLVKQSEVILLLEFAKADDKGMASAAVKKVLKGKFDPKSIKVDFQAGAFEDQGTAMTDIIGEGGKQAMLFIGSFQDGDAGGGSKGFLDLGGKWVSMTSEDKEAWDMEKIDAQMLGTWAGSTDMLVRVVNYIQTNPDALVRVTEGTTWEAPLQAGSIKGKVNGTEAVDLNGDGKLTLFIAGAEGDRLIAWNGKAFQDVTAAHKLASASLACTWADFNSDKKIDLASWDGKSLQLYLAQADGTFKAVTVDVGDALKAGCLGLTTVDCGAKRPEIIATSPGLPVFIMPEGEDGWKAATGALVGNAWQTMGPTEVCLVADFDGDNIPDLMQIGADGSLFWKGDKMALHFGVPVASQVRLGKGLGGASVADFDGDGMLDIVTSSESSNAIWQNRGGGKFEDNVGYSGEVAYIAKAGACSNLVGDFNNDGLQDIVVLYTNRAPHLFFNRGFRCFGHARMMDPELTKALPAADAGELSGCLADLNGDGALDMTMVLKNGEVWIFPRTVAKDGALSLTAALSLESSFAGPLNVRVSKDERDLGTWSVRAGGPGAFIGLEESGPLVLHWCLPGAQPQNKEIVVEGKPVRFVLDRK